MTKMYIFWGCLSGGLMITFIWLCCPLVRTSHSEKTQVRPLKKMWNRRDQVRIKGEKKQQQQQQKETKLTLIRKDETTQMWEYGFVQMRFTFFVEFNRAGVYVRVYTIFESPLSLSLLSRLSFQRCSRCFLPSDYHWIPRYFSWTDNRRTTIIPEVL